MALSEKDRTELRRMLEQRRSALIEEIRAELARSEDQRYVDLAGRVADSGEAAVADLLVDLDAAMTDRDVRELREVEAALARMDDGSYGECRDCGVDIDPARLRANPIAMRCIGCQTRYEHGSAGGRTPSL
jgi:RNA polymerase-binding protein DksA